METTITLTEEVTRILAAASIRQAPLNQIGYPASPGFTVSVFPAAPPRAAVTWHDQPGSQAAVLSLNRCQQVLVTAGYQTELISGPGRRDYLAVFPVSR